MQFDKSRDDDSFHAVEADVLKNTAKLAELHERASSVGGYAAFGTSLPRSRQATTEVPIPRALVVSQLEDLLIATFSEVISAHTLLRILFSMYHTAKTETALQEKVVQSVVRFMESLRGNSSELVSGLVRHFAAELGPSKAGNVVRQCLSGRRQHSSVPHVWEEPLVPPNIFSSALQLSDVCVEEVARQLALLDASLARELTASDCLSLGWLSTGPGGRTARALLERVGLLERWTVERVKTEGLRFARLVLALWHLGDALAALAIAGALMVPSTRQVWCTSTESLEVDEQLSEVAKHLNAATYLSWLRGRGSKPTVPFVPVHFQTLALVAASAPSVFPNASVNLPKLRLLFCLVNDFKLSYNFPFLPVQQVQKFLTSDGLRKAIN